MTSRKAAKFYTQNFLRAFAALREAFDAFPFGIAASRRLAYHPAA